MSYFLNYSPCDVCPNYFGDCCDDCDILKRHRMLMKSLAEEAVDNYEKGFEEDASY